jgi:hypothetical protein
MSRQTLQPVPEALRTIAELQQTCLDGPPYLLRALRACEEDILQGRMLELQSQTGLKQSSQPPAAQGAGKAGKRTLEQVATGASDAEPACPSYAKHKKQIKGTAAPGHGICKGKGKGGAVGSSGRAQFSDAHVAVLAASLNQAEQGKGCGPHGGDIDYKALQAKLNNGAPSACALPHSD